MSNNSENVKKNVPFLKHDVNCLHSYQLVKTDKHMLNLNKETLYNQHHSTIHDYTLNPSNTFGEYPFTGSSELITDITSTGSTLKANNLRIINDSSNFGR